MWVQWIPNIKLQLNFPFPGNELRMRRFREMLPVSGETAKEMATAMQEHNDKVWWWFR